eukprot:TRINITY_DN3914_c0_g2_i1.p1 TRINITY_DN3914_c0_g2~~TRINITY_DN3914_c0_g2_i1.p1  ORF type:complete len:1327 (+),score=241.07 TRINITY_DN3914_c0_g2_i1:1343-5323(+)
MNLLTVLRVPTATVVSVSPKFHTFQGETIVTLTGIGFVDSDYLGCKWFSASSPKDPPYGDAVYARKDPRYLSDATNPMHNVTYINSFKILCKQPPSVNQQASQIPAYLEVSIDNQKYSESNVRYAIYGRPAGLKASKSAVQVLADIESVIEPMRILTVDNVGHDLLIYDRDDKKVPYERIINMRLTNLLVDENSNNASTISVTGLESHRMVNGETEFTNVTLPKPPTGTVEAEFTHVVRGYYFNTTTAVLETHIIDVWKTNIIITITSGRAVALNIAKQPSNVSNHATDLPLTVQPELEFLDPAENIVTKPLVATIGVVAEWMAFIWKDETQNATEAKLCQRPGLCPCVPDDLKSLNYSYAPVDAEACWSSLKSSGTTPTFMDKYGKVTFRDVKLVGFHGVIYKLRFRVTVPADVGETIAPVTSHFIHVGTCSPASSSYGLEFSETCNACPANAICNGTVHIKGISDYWRATNLTTTFYSCNAGVCNSDTVCNVTGCTDPCAPGHVGVQCSVCMQGYGNSNGLCQECPDKDQTNLTIVLFVIIVCVVLSMVVRSNLKIKGRKEKNLPILIKMLITHLQISSRIGEFGTQFPGLMQQIYSTQSSASSASMNTVFLDCASGGGMSQYPKFLGYMFVPLGIIGFSFIVALAIVNIRKMEDALEVRKKEAESERKRKLKLANKGLSRNYYGIAHELADDTDSSVSSDGDMQPRALAHMGDDNEDAEEEEEEEETEALEEEPKQKIALKRPKVRNPDFGNKLTHWDAEPQKLKRKSIHETFDALVPQNEETLDEIAGRRGTLTEIQRKRLERGRGMLQTWLLAFIIVLYFVYPNLIQESSQMLRCVPIHYENDVPYRWPDSRRPEVATRQADVGRTETYLAIDKGINCNTQEYQYYRMLAVIFAMGYGVGIPLLAAAIVRVAIVKKNFASATRAFGFLLMGYREDRWYWEAVVMIRKLAVVFIVVFIQDVRLQTYVGMWVMSLALIVHLWCRPYDSSLLINLEAFSLSVIIATLNFSLLYHWDLEPIYNIGLTIALATATAAVMFLFAYFLAIEGLKKLGEVLNKLKAQISNSATRAKDRVMSVVRRKTTTVQEDEDALDEEARKLAGTRMVTHASTLPDFDRLTLLSKLFVLRGGLQRQDGDYEDEEEEEFEEEEEEEEHESERKAVHNANPWKGIVAGNVLPGVQKADMYPSAPVPTAPDTSEAANERLRVKLKKYKDDEDVSLDPVITDLILDRIKCDMNASDNTRYTRKEAKTEAIEGNPIHAAYMFCHLKKEGITSLAGISDADSQMNLDNMEWGKSHTKEFCTRGRDISALEFRNLWSQALMEYY